MKMRILVKQTTRMGDVLQTSPLIRSLRAKYPDAHITYMVRRMGRIIAEHNPDVDEVFIYDEDQMFLDLRAQDSDRLLRAYETAESLIQRIRDGRYDVAYNCTHSISSAMLLKLADIPNVVGAHLSDDWQFVLRGQWVNYFFTSVFHREYNDLNLCDILGRFAQEAPPSRQLVLDVTDEDRAFVTDMLGRRRIGPDDFVVCFQLGASEDNKRWSEAHFAALGRMLSESRDAKIILVGVQEEEKFGKVFEEHAPGLATHLFGQTSVSQLAALLEHANLLVTNDTGTMHIAAAVGCPIVLVSVGYVHFRETGPYGEGHYAIERRREYVGRADDVPGGLEERTLILPRQVLWVADRLLSEDSAGPLGQSAVADDLAEVDVYVTRFSPDGCLQWYPVLRRPMTERDFLRIAYRAMWLDYLGENRDTVKEQENLRALLGFYDALEDTDVPVMASLLHKKFEGLAELARRGIQETEALIGCLETGRIAKAQTAVHTLVALDEEMRVFGELHSQCRPLVLISRFERDNLEGADPRLLAQTTLQIYRDCHDRAVLTSSKISLLQELWHDISGRR